MTRSLAFFVHHQGRGHARRTEAILEHMDDRPVTILTADPSIFNLRDDRVTFVDLPNAIGDPSATAALHGQDTPDAMQCVPMGSANLRANAGLIAATLTSGHVGLMVNDVSVEWALMARLCSVPAVKIRMHGDRSDASHTAAYQACAGMIAPFHEDLEQADYPAWARRKTFYSGGLCTTTAPVPSREEARARLGWDADKQHILVLSGGGGTGALYASLTMGARALPDAHWTSIGPVHLEGHETDFHNLTRAGWVDNVMDYMAAADVVVASAGDNTVHEIARAKRPFLCIPEWRYYDEQHAKADELARLGAAHVLHRWPASNGQWQRAIAGALETGTRALEPLFDDDAARKIAHHLIELDARLWDGASSGEAHGPAPASGLQLVG